MNEFWSAFCIFSGLRLAVKWHNNGTAFTALTTRTAVIKIERKVMETWRAPRRVYTAAIKTKKIYSFYPKISVNFIRV